MADSGQVFGNLLQCPLGGLAAKSSLILATPGTIAHQAPLSMGISMQEYWNGLPFPSPGVSFPPRNWTWVSWITGRFFTNWDMREFRAVLEKAMAPHSSTLAWKILWMEEPGGLQSTGLRRVGHHWATSLSLSCIGEGNGNPLQCSCLENPRDGEPGGLPSMGSQSRTQLKWLSSSSGRAVFLNH